MEFRKATKTDLPQLASLFNNYRIFYNQESDIELASNFLTKRMDNNESTVFVAVEGDSLIGFVQLYPTFSSIAARNSLVLNDLYVSKEYRRSGAGEGLIRSAIDYANEINAKGLELTTAHDNHTAKSLYEKIGFSQESDFAQYHINC